MLIVSFVLVALSAESVASLYGGCVTVSVLVHYFTLVAVMWMAAEALLMFQKLVIVFVRITTKFIVGISILCWSKCNVHMHRFISMSASFFSSILQLHQLFWYSFPLSWTWQLVMLSLMTSLFEEELEFPCKYNPITLLSITYNNIHV